MGSFNQTCAISNLPILDLQRVRIIFLVKSTGHPSQCYPTLHYTPLPVFATGIYEDEGGVTDIKYPDDFLSYFTLTYSDYDPAIDLDPILYIKSKNKEIDHPRNYPIDFVLIHDFVYQDIVGKHIIERLNKNFEQLLIKTVEEFKVHSKFSYPDVSSLLTYPQRVMTFVQEYLDLSENHSLFTGSVLWIMTSYLEKHSYTESLDLMYNALAISFLNDFMQSVNRFWIKPPLGSTDTSRDSYDMLSQVLRAKAQSL